MFPRWHTGTGLGGCVRLPHPPTGLEGGTQWRRVFRGEGSELGVLRRWLAGLLPPGPARDGLLLVRALAVRTGVSGTAKGRLVWADIRLDAGPHQLAAGGSGPVR